MHAFAKAIQIKIVAFVTHAAQIQHILMGLGWSTKIPEFDPPYELASLNILR